MGINLVPEVGNFGIVKAYFQRRNSSSTVPPGLIPYKNGSVEEGCINEGEHKIMVFATTVHNRGNENLIIGKPEDRLDIFEPAPHMQNGWRTKEKLYEYALKDSAGNTVASGYKRAWCIMDHSTFTCRNQGISVGDHDTYNTDQNCQFLPIDTLVDGEYSLEVIINPSGVFKEDNYDDNKYIKKLKIRGISVRPI